MLKNYFTEKIFNRVHDLEYLENQRYSSGCKAIRSYKSKLDIKFKRLFMKNKWKGTSEIFFLTGLLFLFSLFGFFITGPQACYAVSAFPPGDIWFPPADRGDLKLIELLDKAESEIKFCFFDIELETIGQALINAHNRGVLVKVVTDNNYLSAKTQVDELEAAGIEVKSDGDSGLMHNKFAVIDNATLWMGSYNVTENGTYYNNNNALVIKDVLLANNFRVEFDEMFNDELFGASSPANTPNQYLNINGITVETLFAPEDKVTSRIVEEISKATTFVYFEAFSYTSDPIFNAMKERLEAGVYIKGIFESQQVAATAKYTKYMDLKKIGADVILDTNPNNMHNKTIIIDGTTVITGSFNFSASAEEKNDESTLIIKSSAVAGPYMTEFARMFTLFTGNESIRGFVTDSANSKYLSGASVTCLSDSSLMKSDEYGWYRLININDISYKLRAEKEGYFSYEATITEPLDRHDIPMNPIVTKGIVKGIIIDALAKPIEGADVLITHTAISGIKTYIKGITKSDGSFEINNVPASQVISDRVKIVISKASYISFEQDNFDVPANDSANIGTRALKNFYQVSGFMNPVMEKYASLVIKDNSANPVVPIVTVTQNNYVPVSVTFQAIPGNSGLFSGVMEILPNYVGKAVIDVNQGQGKGELYVFTLEPRTGITVEASSKQGVSSLKQVAQLSSDQAVSNQSNISVFFPAGSVSDKRTGLISIQTADKDDTDVISHIFEISGLEKLDTTAFINIQFQNSIIQGKTENQGKMFACIKKDNKWKILKNSSVTREANNAIKVVAETESLGKIAVLQDTIAPAIAPVSGAEFLDNRVMTTMEGPDYFSFSIEDNLSGNTSVCVKMNDRVVAHEYDSDLGIVRIASASVRPSDATVNMVPVEITSLDQAGNTGVFKSVVWFKQAEVVSNFRAWPCPARAGETITIDYSLQEDSRVIIDIFDYSGTSIKKLLDSDIAAGANNSIWWDCTDMDGNLVPNGTYIYRIEAHAPSGFIKKYGKTVVLK